jgi:hypothetical protein
MLHSGLFWGTIIILFGLSIIVKHVFHIDIPVFKILIGLILIAIGLKILFINTGAVHFRKINKEGNKIVFTSGSFDFDPEQSEYNVVFGKSVLDMTSLNESIDKRIKLNSVFGEIEVYINNNTIVRINSSSVFGNVSAPEPLDYANDTSDSTVENYSLHFNANSIFGNIVFKRK